jgi:hypothetical protein
VLRRGKWYVHKKRYLRLDLIIRSGSCGAETPVYVRCVYLEKFLFALLLVVEMTEQFSLLTNIRVLDARLSLSGY